MRRKILGDDLDDVETDMIEKLEVSTACVVGPLHQAGV